MEKEIKALHAGPAPLIGALCDEQNIVEMVNSLVNRDDKQWNLNPGLLVKAMIINILSGRTAFYQYESFFEDIDTCPGHLTCGKSLWIWPGHLINGRILA